MMRKPAGSIALLAVVVLAGACVTSRGPGDATETVAAEAMASLEAEHADAAVALATAEARADGLNELLDAAYLTWTAQEAENADALLGAMNAISTAEAGAIQRDADAEHAAGTLQAELEASHGVVATLAAQATADMEAGAQMVQTLQADIDAAGTNGVAIASTATIEAAEMATWVAGYQGTPEVMRTWHADLGVRATYSARRVEELQHTLAAAASEVYAANQALTRAAYDAATPTGPANAGYLATLEMKVDMLQTEVADVANFTGGVPLPVPGVATAAPYPMPTLTPSPTMIYSMYTPTPSFIISPTYTPGPGTQTALAPTLLPTPNPCATFDSTTYTQTQAAQATADAPSPTYTPPWALSATATTAHYTGPTPDPSAPAPTLTAYAEFVATIRASLESPTMVGSPLPTYTITPAVSPTWVNIHNILFEAVEGVGDLEMEAVILRNMGDTFDPESWQLCNTEDECFVFPSFDWHSNQTVMIRTATGAETEGIVYYWGRREPAWASGEQVILLNARGNTVFIVYAQ